MGILDQFRRKQPDTTSKEVGRSGTLNTRGFLDDEEVNRKLRWPLNLDIYDEMRRTDPTCRWMLGLVKAPIRSASWMVEPASKEPEDREVAAFVERCLFNELDGGFDDLLRRALLYLEFGHSVFERVAELRQVSFTWKDDDGNETQIEREAFVISRMAHRPARTVERWVPDDTDPSRLKEIEQWLGDGRNPRTVIIDASKLVVFTHEQEGDNWRGTSLLRSAYKDYRYKKALENLEAIALERSAGLPVAYMPGGADDPEWDAMEDALKKIRQGENLYLMVPGAKWSPQNPEGYLVEDLTIQGAGGSNSGARSPLSEAINRHEASMARNVMAEFMRLGHENAGARATADVQQGPYYQVVESHVQFIEDVITEGVIAPLVAWNYSTDRLPKLTAGKIQGKNVEVIAAAGANLLTAGGLTWEPELENWFRSVLEAPELAGANADKAVDQRLNPPEPPAPGGEEEDPPPDDDNDEGGGGRRLSEFRPSRPLRAEETHVALAEIDSALDEAQERLEQVALAALEGPLSQAEGHAEAAAEIGSATAAASIVVDPKPIEGAVEAVLLQTYDRGRREVERELASQRNRVAFAEPEDPEPIVGPVTRGERARRLGALAGSIAENVAGAAERALRAVTQRRVETPAAPPVGPGFDPRQAARGAARGSALNVIAGVFNDGRRDAALDHADEISRSVYSAILDGKTCGPCREADGTEGPPGGLEDMPCPNPMCEGGGACRCMWVEIIDAF
jgi:hypothetical protein